MADTREERIERRAMEIGNLSNGNVGAISAEQWWVLLSEEERERDRAQGRRELSTGANNE